MVRWRTIAAGRPAGALARFLLASVALALALESAAAVRAGVSGAGARVFAGAALVSTALYLHLPAMGLLGLRALCLRGRCGRAVRLAAHALGAGAFASCLLVALLLLANLRVFSLYGFHINAFVWNLLVTPGGIESLGAGRATWLSAGALALACAAALALLLAAARWSARRDLPRLRLAPVLPLAGLALLGGERLAYAVGHARGCTSIVLAADAVPFYAPITARGLAHRLGLSGEAAGELDAVTRLDYPRAALAAHPEAPDLDLVWLVAESLRFDMLDPEIMPATWAFSETAGRFERHASGGNGTRMGMFSLFYGLPGSYWFSFLRERRGPVLIDYVVARGYDVRASTSARFTYPEFDHTIFAALPRERLVEFRAGEPFERDRAAVDALVERLERAGDGPRFAFHFFEATHAPYTFPPEAAFRGPYPEEVDYARLDPDDDREGLFNRYANACRFLDGEIARVLGALERAGALERTIVVITGDHGEEFLEDGRWGHGSTFSDEQVLVPLVVRIPGRAPLVARWRTSHVDVAPTVLAALGVHTPPAAYSTGQDLFTEDRGRFVVLSDWSRVAVADDRFLQVLPTGVAGFMRSERLTAEGEPAGAEDFDPWSRARLPLLLEQLSRFRAR